jgi:hypothetical protein
MTHPTKQTPLAMSEDPFSPTPNTPPQETGAGGTSTTALVSTDYYYTDILPNGDVARMKLESGIPVVVKNLGKAKDWFNKALLKASMITPTDAESLDEGEMTHIELAALRMAQAGAMGDLSATREMMDRVLGKPKQYSENTTLSLTLDDVLMGRPQEVDVEPTSSED